MLLAARACCCACRSGRDGFLQLQALPRRAGRWPVALSAASVSTRQSKSSKTRGGKGTDTQKNTRTGSRQRKNPAWNPLNPAAVNQNSEWSSVCQTARPFDPYLIPIPIRMGLRPTGGEPPVALGNLELMKIPNFFHLTPPAIEKHCKALKPLCTPWPTKLPHLPLMVETRNYVFASASVKHPDASKVIIKFQIKDLNLSDHARKKMIELAGERYNESTDTVSLIGKRCPTRKQNYDYVIYLMKVLYLESNKVEPWEPTEGEGEPSEGGSDDEMSTEGKWEGETAAL